MADGDQLGLRVLQLLAEDWMISVLTELADGPIRPAELERRLPHAGHAVVIRRLRRLLDNGAAHCERRPGVPPHAGSDAVPRRAYYSLSDAGATLLQLTAEAERWEQRWYSLLERGAPPGILAVGLCANKRTRKIMLSLADGPLAAKEMQRRLPEVARSTLRRRLQDLVLGGLLERQAPAGVQRYELTARARQLARLATLAGRWEWQWRRPEHAAPCGDLVELMHVLAPIARISRPLAGRCHIRLQESGTAVSDVYLEARAGHIRALRRAPARAPEAVAHITPEAWCEALLAPNDRVAVAGDRTLMLAVVGALSTALLDGGGQTDSATQL